MTGLCDGRATAGEDWWTSDDRAERERAKLICDRCPVAADCLRGALARGEKWGVWAGLDLGAVDMAEPVAFVRPAVYAPVHNRAHYMSGCRHPDCLAANARYMANWREQRAWSAPVVRETPPEQLDLFGQVTSEETIYA